MFPEFPNPALILKLSVALRVLKTPRACPRWGVREKLFLKRNWDTLSRRFNYIVKTKYINDLGIVYLWLGPWRKYYWRGPFLYSVHSRLCSRVQWFSTFFWFYHMAAFHEWDLLVLRPLKKILRTPHRVHVRQNFHFQKIAGTLKMNIFFWKFAEFFLIHKRTIVKNKIWN